MAVGLEPGDRALETLPVVLVGLGEPGRQVGELELLLIDLLAAANQLGGERLAGLGASPQTPASMLEIVRTSVCVSTKSACKPSKQHESKEC
jgi:hypothetical protein